MTVIVFLKKIPSLQFLQANFSVFINRVNSLLYLLKEIRSFQCPRCRPTSELVEHVHFVPQTFTQRLSPFGHLPLFLQSLLPLLLFSCGLTPSSTTVQSLKLIFTKSSLFLEFQRCNSCSLTTTLISFSITHSLSPLPSLSCLP